MGKTVADAVSAYGASAKAKLARSRSPARRKINCAGRSKRWSGISPIGGLPAGTVDLVGETTLADIKTRPDFAVTVSKALVGFIEVKAPGKGADPRKFNDPHDKDQWDKLKSLPNLIYTDGNAFSLWRDGKLEGTIVHLEGDVETSGAKLEAPGNAAALDQRLPAMESDSAEDAPSNSHKSARGSAVCLRDEVIEQMALGSPA